MKILLTNHHLYLFGGTENLLYEHAKKLFNLGHEICIYIYTEDPKSLASDWIKSNLPEAVRWFYEDPPPEDFDLLLITHNTCLQKLTHHKGYKIFFCHSPYQEIEFPKEGADHYVFVTKEIQEKFPEIKNSSVIPTGYNLADHTFKYKDKRKTILMFEYHPNNYVNIFMNTCKKEGMIGEIYCRKNMFPSTITQMLQTYDIICATGRTANEALLSGNPTIVFNHFGCGGLITKDNYEKLAISNFTGRHLDNKPSFAASFKQALKIQEAEISSIAQHIKATRNLNTIVERILSYAK